MIISSTEFDQFIWVNDFEEHTKFFQIIISTWNWTLSIEENYIAIYTTMNNDPEIDYLPTLYDYDTENPCYI